MGWGCEKEGSSQQTTKKRKKIKKNAPGAATSPLAFVSGKAQPAQIQEKGYPPAFVNERGSQCTCEERERSAGKKRAKKMNQVQGHRARDAPLMFAQEGAPVHL